MDVPTILLVCAVAVTAALGGAYLFTRWKGRGQTRSDAVYHFRCTGCQRRLRFSSRQVGRKGSCSHCGKEITFPAVSQSVD